MIDKITEIILEEEEDKYLLAHLLEGYNLKCAICGRVITMVKDGEGPLSCCNQRMFVMSSNPDLDESIEVSPAEIEKARSGANTYSGYREASKKEIKGKEGTFKNYLKALKKEDFTSPQGIKTALKGEVVKPDFQVGVGQAHFSPFDQPTTQAKQREVWKQKETPKMESELLKDMELFYEAGFEHKPKGWTGKSVKKFGKSLVKGGGTKKGFFDKCVNKMKGKVSNPEGFCASVKDESYGSTYWRGKGKSVSKVASSVKKHKNV
jgi:desulfoferrodoxin-like iron-binding protein